ncbi:MAG: aldose epimerase family protein [Faecalibacterium sp.]
MAQISSKPFGVTKAGENVTEYTILNPGGLTVRVLNYGCVIKDIIVPSKAGPVDVVLGHDTMSGYEADFNSPGSTCCGAFVGRYANRIENASFSVGGRTYQLEPNSGPNHLHGCFSRKLYRVKAFGDTLLMEAESPDGEDGFPGNLKIAVRYTLAEDNTFRMDYRVSTDADTIVNLTNHSYFNLDGGGSVLGQKLRLYASRYLESNESTCPTGRILPVADTPMDFTGGKPIGQDMDVGFAQMDMVGGGYDHCYVIDRDRGSSQSICAWATSEKTGISMKLYTTQPGIQLYTGNFLHNCPTPGKGGRPMQKYGGFALETQHYPCSPSHPEFPTTVLRADKVFRATTTLRFFTGKQCGKL